jgi:hypothetical protein
MRWEARVIAVRAAAVARVGAAVARVAAVLAAVLLNHNHHECWIHPTSSPQHSQGGHAVSVSCRVRRGGSSSQGLPPRGCFPLQDRLPHGMGYRYQEVGAGRLDLDGNWRQQPHGGWLAAQPGTISASGASNGQILAGRAVMQRWEGRCVRRQYGHRGVWTALGAPRHTAQWPRHGEPAAVLAVAKRRPLPRHAQQRPRAASAILRSCRDVASCVKVLPATASWPQGEMWSVAYVTRMCPFRPRSSSLDDFFSKMSFCIAYQACSSVSMHALNTHDAPLGPLGPQPPLRPQFSRGYCHRTALHVGSKRASNRAPKHHLCALEAHVALVPGTQSLPYLRYRRAYHTAIEDRPLSK